MTDLAASVIETLGRRGWTLGVAESLTGGAVIAELVGVPGASSVVLGGVVAYATPVKHTLLGVDESLLDREGPVHPEVARQMARGVRHAVSVDGIDAAVGVATTGIAGPVSPDGQSVGTVHIAVATPERIEARSFLFPGDRNRIRSASVRAALEMLRELSRE
ncbi:CinA family protein [Microbacterium sp. kSW2-24]|uniref:CinA family protein n=1 Tax=Microbacterium galbinum TaxID=2851646 RepID=UPI001FFDB501|nr:CinA family protein [Microbacterium galbinum]MCK2022001.1 CinA family protein [Microbacterium galbinum]